MYSSSSSIFTPFPQLTSTIHLPSHPNFFSQMEGDSIFLHHNRHDLLPGLFFPSDSDVPRVNNIARPESSQQLPRTTSKKKNVSAKKDRHSKIYTAQGPRDRRVRLSMEIARKFFDLQDLLGFDKASKTLDWLLTHSKAAIKELVQMKINCTTGGGEMIYENNYCNKNETTSVVANDKRDAFDISSRESRAKARARARDRTREKMRAKEQQLDQESLRVIDARDLSQSSRSCWPHTEPSCDLTECWDINTDVILAEHQYYGKPCEAYNNYTIPVE
ncbi:hypothetical protein LguiA_006204 [Lonicera macranthoides]